MAQPRIIYDAVYADSCYLFQWTATNVSYVHGCMYPKLIIPKPMQVSYILSLRNPSSRGETNLAAGIGCCQFAFQDLVQQLDEISRS